MPLSGGLPWKGSERLYASGARDGQPLCQAHLCGAPHAPLVLKPGQAVQESLNLARLLQSSALPAVRAPGQVLELQVLLDGGRQIGCYRLWSNSVRVVL